MGNVSIWHWIIVLIVFAIPGWVIYHAIKTSRSENGIIVPGIRGWLFIFAIAVWLSPLRALTEFIKAIAEHQKPGNQFPILTQIDIAISFISFLMMANLLYLFIKKSSSFRGFFKIMFAWVFISLPLSLISAVIALDLACGLSINFEQLVASAASEIGAWAGGLIASLGWLLYVLRSRRVATTFVR